MRAHRCVWLWRTNERPPGTQCIPRWTDRTNRTYRTNMTYVLLVLYVLFVLCHQFGIQLNLGPCKRLRNRTVLLCAFSMIHESLLIDARDVRRSIQFDLGNRKAAFNLTKVYLSAGLDSFWREPRF